MKKLTIFYAFLIFIGTSCEQENFIPTPQETEEEDPCGESPSAGSADFSKFVALGSSYMAGFQAGALFTDGQNNSLAMILNTALGCVGASSTFNQPTIGSEHGFNVLLPENPLPGPTILGRLLLQGTPPKPSPAIAGLEALPDPTENPDFMYTGATADLNNFSVAAVYLGQIFQPETGDWGNTSHPYFSPFYARFASNPGTSTMLGDFNISMTNGGTFFAFWMGMDDFLLYALNGADPTIAPLTSLATFQYLYGGSMSTILGTNPSAKGVIANFPNIWEMPHFTSVPYNAIPLDASQASDLTSQLANGYNAFLDGMVFNTVITQDEADDRYLSFEEGANPILLTDSTLTDLTPFMTTPYDGLLPYAMARQATEEDVVPLGSASVLGTDVEGVPGAVWGVSFPASDKHVLTADEVLEIEQRRVDFNAFITTVSTGNPSIALADVEAYLSSLYLQKVKAVNGLFITPNINPPTGIYSEDGLHLNSRGYAYIAGAFIDAINADFEATIEKPSLANYKATALPVNP